MWGLFSSHAVHQRRLQEAERDLLAAGNVSRPYKQHKVEIEDGVHVHTVSFNAHEGEELTAADKDKKHLVLTHGYAAGTGFWYRNLEGLASIPDTTLHAIDWLGNGQSSRVEMPKEPEKSEEVEHIFVDSLEKWRKNMGMERMVLIGHSLGGYLSACYAMKYPERVEKLVLVSPVGLPEKPADFEESIEKRLQGRPAWQRGLYSMVRSGWEKNITPQAVVRGLGPFGQSFSQMMLGRRFAHIFSEEEKRKIAAYFYYNSVQKGSGEYALNTILSFGAFARRPLASRLPDLRVPTTFIYGSHDWMDHTHAQSVIPRMKVPAKLHIVPQSGHQLFLENPEHFNKIIQSVVQDLRDKRT